MIYFHPGWRERVFQNGWSRFEPAFVDGQSDFCRQSFNTYCTFLGANRPGRPESPPGDPPGEAAREQALLTRVFRGDALLGASESGHTETVGRLLALPGIDVNEAKKDRALRCTRRLGLCGAENID